MSKIEFKAYKPSDSNNVKTLFENVFTDSEGKTEGNLIGKLVSKLQETTNSKDIFGFVAKDGKKHCWGNILYPFNI